MAGKKKKEKELTEAEKAMLEDDEVAALEAPDEEGENLEQEDGKSDEQGAEGKKEEEGKEGEPPEKEAQAEPPKGEGEKVEAKEGEGESEDVEIPDQTATALKDLNIPIQTKNGKHFIPFSELEKARKKAGEYKAENEQLRTDIGTLSSRLEVLEKPPEEKPTELNLDEIERQIYDGEITPKEGMELVKKAGLSEKPHEEAEKPMSAAEIAAQVKEDLMHEAGMEKIKAATEKIYEDYPILKGNRELETKVFRFSYARILEAMEGLSEQEQIAWRNNPDNIINAGREAAKEVADLMTPRGSENFDPEAEREKIREEEVANLVTQLNLKPDEVKTLTGVRASSGPTNKKEELDQKSGEDLEDAMADMEPEERVRYVDDKLD